MLCDALLEVEQRRIHNRHHAGGRVDGEAAARIVEQAVGDRAAVRIVEIGRDADRGAVHRAFRHGIGAAVVVGREGRRGVGHVDREVLRAGQRAGARLHGEQPAGHGLEVDLGRVGDRDHAGAESIANAPSTLPAVMV